MSLESSIAELVRASTELTGTVRGKTADIDNKVAAKISEMEAWRTGAKNDFALPFVAEFVVDGDADKFYPVPLLPTSVGRLGRLVIGRHYGAPHPASITGGAGLLLEMSIRGEPWLDFHMNRVEYYAFSYAQTLGAFRSDGMGRVFWLRGGGMHYGVYADFDLRAGAIFDGTENLKPILSETAIYPLSTLPPFKGGGVKVGPISAPDAQWAKEIQLQTVI